MEPVPLIPERDAGSGADMSYLVRAEFADVLGEKQIAVETLSKLLNGILQNEQLTKFVQIVHDNYREMETHFQLLNDAEKALLQAKINLLLSDSNKNIAVQQNQETTDLKANDTYRTYKRQYKGDSLVLFKNDIYKDGTPSGISESVKCKTSCRCNNIDETKSPTKESQPCKQEQSEEQVFVAEPNIITIKNYKKNVLYEEYFFLHNVTDSSQSFFTPIVQQPSDFKVMLMSPSQCVQAGKSAKFLVTFLTNKFVDTTEDLKITVPGAKDVLVRLISCRLPPKLKGLVYYNLDDIGKVRMEDKEKDEVANKTIDCGTCLLGSTTLIKFVIKNVGGDGSFFLMSEEDWVLYNVFDVTEKFKLCMKEFTISPVFFELNTHETKELKVTYKPVECGLSVNKFCILCDNNTLKEIDIIGDCQMFRTDILKFEFGKLNNETVQGSTNCNCLYFGNVHNHSKLVHKFTIFNTSSLRIEFCWKIHEIEPEPDKGILSMKENWIDIQPKSGCFEQYRRKEFEISILMDAPETGHYSCSLSFYALNIPEESLPISLAVTLDDGVHFKPEANKNFWNIQVEQFEILICNIPIEVAVIPDEVSYELLEINTESRDELIEVSNDGDLPINFEWVALRPSENIQVTFDPVKFPLRADTSLYCTLKVMPLKYNDFDETYQLLVNDHPENLELRVKGTVQQPGVTVVKALVDFGIVRKDLRKMLPVSIKNTHHVSLEWCAIEFNFDFNKNAFTEIKDTNLSQNYGKLRRLQSCDHLVYNLDTSVERKHLSIIVFYSLYDNSSTQSSHVIVTANIIEPVVRITNENYSDEIFTLRDIYTVYDEFEVLFFLNNESQVSTSYRWLLPIGSHISMALTQFNEVTGRLPKLSRQPVHLKITFQKPGLIHDFHIPCIVDGMEEPIYLQLCARVKNFQYVISVPKKDRFIDIYWPPGPQVVHYEETSSDAEEIASSNADDNGEVENLQVQLRKSPASDDYYYKPENENNLYTVEEIRKYIEANTMDFDPEIDLSELRSSEMQSVTEESISEKTIENNDICTINLPTLIQYENVIEYCNVPCREAYKKFIYIENPSKLPVKFMILPTKFPETQNDAVNADHDALMKLKWKPKSQAQYFSPKLSVHGIVVEPRPNTGVVKSGVCLKIDLWVYAETWGYYLEELRVEIGSLPAFCLKLIIEVVGQPIEYPIIMSTEEQIPLINFGSLAYDYNIVPQKRIVKVHNSSTIPYVIVWHLLTKDLEDYHSRNPINVLLDFFSFKDKDVKLDCKIRLTKYYGKELLQDGGYFQIEPRELYFEPRETRELCITFTPTLPNDNFETKKLKAIVLGHVYIANEYSCCRNTFQRDSIRDLKPTKIHLSAQLECPKFDFEHVRGKTSISMSVEDILSGIKVEENFCLLFKTNNSSCAKVYAFTEKPFEIISAKTVLAKQSNDQVVPVHGGQCLKINMKCYFSSKSIMELADAFYDPKNCNLKNVTKTENSCMIISKNLDIHQKCGFKQCLPLKVVLSFPNITVSMSKIDFKEVRIGSKEYRSITLLNNTNMETKFKVSVTSKCVFAVEPCCGCLKPKMLHDRTCLTVCFRPRNTIQYEDLLRIETCLPQYNVRVYLRGEGVCDENYYDT